MKIKFIILGLLVAPPLFLRGNRLLPADAPGGRSAAQTGAPVPLRDKEAGQGQRISGQASADGFPRTDAVFSEVLRLT